MTEQYLTIQKQSSGIFKAKGSKFLSFALPVQDVDEVKVLLAAFKKEYYNARHLCYAYMLGVERDDFRVNDDGEPSGTAGKPILGQINSRGLTNVLIIVVRYFGGVLLGTGGLISAYKAAAADAIEQAEIIEKTVDCYFEIVFEYPVIETVMSAVKESQAAVISQIFNENCKLKLHLPLANKSVFLHKLEKVAMLKVIS